MTEHISEARLNDWLDGTVKERERQEIQEHLAGCPACGAEAERLRRIIERVRGLPKEIPVPPRVWRGVESRMSEERVTAGFAAWLGRNALPVAASVAAVLVGGALLIAALRGRGAPDSSSAPEAGGAAIEELARVEREFDAAAAQLQALVDANRDALPPDAVAALDSSLASLDLAAARIRVASQESPERPHLARQARQIHLQKLALLERAIRISRSEM